MVNMVAELCVASQLLHNLTATLLCVICVSILLVGTSGGLTPLPQASLSDDKFNSRDEAGATTILQGKTKNPLKVWPPEQFPSNVSVAL